MGQRVGTLITERRSNGVPFYVTDTGQRLDLEQPREWWFVTPDSRIPSFPK